MFLDTLPLVFVLAGLVLYIALGGADYGAGIWQLLSPGARGAPLREHAHHSMGPVWEANHVWLIFILTVTWTAYPVFLGSLASTLGAALLLGGLGIIVRGASYALRSAAETEREMAIVDGAFAVASLLAPFALGCAAGGVAAERVPVGNAAGPLFASWLNPTSIIVGLLAVAFSAYLAAVFLAADAARREQPELVEAFRRRALGAGVVAGGLAAAGLVVIGLDAHGLLVGLLHGGGLAMMILSALGGLATVALVLSRRFELARGTAALAVAAVIAGWAFARYPVLLPALTVRQAAAAHSTLICLVVAVVAGGAILFPSLGLLFTLTLKGSLGGGTGGQPGGETSGQPGGETGGQPGGDPAGGDDPAGGPARSARPVPALLGPRPGLRISVALLIVGVGTLNAADAGWAHLIGVLALLAFVVLGAMAVIPAVLREDA